MMLKFLVLFLLCFGTLTWVLFRTLRKTHLPPDSDEDGGTPVDAVFPTFDPPSGHGLDDWLTDRPPRDSEKPNRPIPQGR